MTRFQRISLGALLGLQLLIGLVAATAQPLWLGHEPDYFSVVRFLADNGRLPSRSDYEGAPRDADIAQATQPPLFSYVALPVVALLDDGDAVPPGLHPGLICEGTPPTAYPYMLTTAYNMPLGSTPVAGYSLRIMNLLFALGMTALVYLAARRIAAGNHGTALLAAAFVAFQPQIFALSVFISGESLLLLISSANLYFALRLVGGEGIRPIDLAGVIITAILGPLTKTNGYVLIIATAALLAYLILHHMINNPRSRTTRLLLVGAGVLILAVIALSIFNYTRYGSVIGRYQNTLSMAINSLEDLNTVNLVAMLRDTNYDYTGVFPFQRQKLLRLYTLGGVFGLFLFAGHMVHAAIRRNKRQLVVDGLLFGYALIAFVLVLMRANLVSDLTPDKTHTPLRYYVSGLPAMAVMLAIGWQSLLPPAWRHWLNDRIHTAARLQPWQWFGWAWALVWLIVVVWNIAPNIIDHPARSLYPDAEFATLANEGNVTLVADDPSGSSDIPHLRAYEATAGEDGVLHMTAYLQVGETPALNYVARVRVEDSNGASTACELIPHDGRYPVTRWEPDQIVAVEMEIPNCSEDSDALSGPLDVTLDWLPASADGELITRDGSGAQNLVVNADLPRARTCLRNLGVIGDVFQVIQYNGPATATIGTPFLPSINWYVRDSITNSNLWREYVLKHDESGESFVCLGVPRLWDYAIALWRRGEIIYFDQCAFTLPPEAPTGEYSLMVGLVDRSTEERLPVTPREAEATDDNLLHVTTITVTAAPQPVAGAN